MAWTEVNKMQYKKEIYEFLRLVEEKLEYPCDECGYDECEKNPIKELLLKKYREFNIIDYRQCLKERKEEYNRLMKVLRKFNESYEKCTICKKKFFKWDMKLHSEIEKEAKTNPPLKVKTYGVEIFRLCNKCNRSYVHRKEALNKGFKKTL